MGLLQHVETLGEDVTARGHHHHHQQQFVRERGRRIKAVGPCASGPPLGPRCGPHQRPQRGGGDLDAGGRAAAGAGEGGHDAAAGGGAAAKDHEEEEEEADDDEVVAVEEKVAQLRQLVPGGEDMAVEGLLEETAHYIAALKAQVGVMRALTCLLSASGSDLDALRPPESAAAAAGLLTPEKPV